jgi:hypothetical protein
MATNRGLSKVEMLSLELLIAMAQEKGRAPGDIMINHEERTGAIAAAMAQMHMERTGGFVLSETAQKANPRKLQANPTLRNLMDVHAEASKRRK